MSEQIENTIKNEKVLVSGMRTTGSLHLGHLVGTLENWVKLQENHRCYFFLAVWHAFTDRLSIPDLQNIIKNMVIDWISVGIDPCKSVIFRQSAVPQHAELAIIFSMFTPLGWLERCPTFKEDVRDDEARSYVSLGKLSYPVLMTADIAAYKGEVVPVGKDQLPHLELAREIIRRFNSHIFPLFPEPKEYLSETPILLGLDNRKMSKSYNNTIELRDSSETVLAKINSMITDPQRVKRYDPGNPEVCNVYNYHKIFSLIQLEEIYNSCKTASIGCKDCKKILFRNIEQKLTPIREKRFQLEKNPNLVFDILNEGEKIAKARSESVLQEVRSKLNFN